MSESKYYQIEKYGSELLRQPCSVVSKFDRKLEKIVDKMLKTMYHQNGIGLAAPQIGVNQRILIIDIDWASERYEEERNKEPEYNPVVMINPVIVYQEGEMDSFEGCLSFPDVFFKVKRARRIIFKFQDLKGKDYRVEAAEDLFCRCVQHEIDHLNGKLFVDIALDKAIAREELANHGFGDVNSPPPMILG
ncbi:MAG: peptide deformylase [Cyanobacteria bacterium]|nr:peptide deformylase [Cyanobacteriota bacterium]MDA1020395.1 peptide deformylase [Cyanobacteriota bacterium]